jgi:predicted RNA-binding protein with PUA-like domain
LGGDGREDTLIYVAHAGFVFARGQVFAECRRDTRGTAGPKGLPRADGSGRAGMVRVARGGADSFQSSNILPSSTQPGMPKETDYSSGAWASTFAPRANGERRYWLVKSEPDAFSFDDLLALPKKTTTWDGVRNFTARNFLRDGMKKGDQVFFYHSSTNPQAIVGVCEVVRDGYPDAGATDRSHAGFDDKSDPAKPTWFAVDLKAVETLRRPVTLAEIKATPALSGMALVRISRLSVVPVSEKEWEVVRGLANKPPTEPK